LLEIGCASGSFLHKMHQLGWEVEGIEPSSRAAEYAQSRGYVVRTGSLESLSNSMSHYDLIVGWHVLEHLHDPLFGLRKLSTWSKPGGWLVLSMPDAGALEFKIFKDAWYALSLPTHLYHFTTATLGRLLNLGGWRLERIIWEENPKNLLASLSYRLRDAHWTKPADFFREFSEGERLGRLRIVLGKVLARLRNSGRITVWATRIEM
jgi:SAM-dependent methyltransferase